MRIIYFDHIHASSPPCFPRPPAGLYPLPLSRFCFKKRPSKFTGAVYQSTWKTSSYATAKMSPLPPPSTVILSTSILVSPLGGAEELRLAWEWPTDVVLPWRLGLAGTAADFQPPIPELAESRARLPRALAGPSPGPGPLLLWASRSKCCCLPHLSWLQSRSCWGANENVPLGPRLCRCFRFSNKDFSIEL